MSIILGWVTQALNLFNGEGTPGRQGALSAGGLKQQETAQLSHMADSLKERMQGLKIRSYGWMTPPLKETHPSHNEVHRAA